MATIRFLLALSLCILGAWCEYVQTQACNDFSSNDISHSSLSARIEAARGDKGDVLSLEIIHGPSPNGCDGAMTDFSADLTLEMLGRQSQYYNVNSTFCRTFNTTFGSTGEYVVYPITQVLGILPPLSTFEIQLQLHSKDDHDLGCFRANITPAMSTKVSTSFTWVPLAVFLFVLLVGVLRGLDEKSSASMGTSDLSELSLPGVGDCLGYLQFAFLSGGLSLHYPGFFQPVISKLNLFSLFVTGPLTHGITYPSVSDGIYSINGTYGGTTGLEHMHQIVGAPMTRDTWINMVIAIMIITLAIALILETVALFQRRLSQPQGVSIEGRRASNGLLSRITAVLRIVLSYFTLPLSALSFYQLSAATWLPVWHTTFATVLIVAIMLAFVWLLWRLPARTAGRLIYDTPKWFQDQFSQGRPPHSQRDDRAFLTVVVMLTFVRGAAVGGLQMYGPAQLAILGTSEILHLVAIRWLHVYPMLSMGIFAPVSRLAVYLLMICFARGVALASARSAVGYSIITIHACMVVFGIFSPAAYHCFKIVWRRFSSKSDQNIRSRRLEYATEPISSIALARTHAPARESNISLHERGGVTTANEQMMDLDTSPTSSKYEYFRQPRHSSSRIDFRQSKAPVASIAPTRSSSARSFDVSLRPTTGSSQSLASDSEGSDDAWNDTRTIPLGPRWNDYSFRESDAFYGSPTVVRPPVSVTDRTLTRNGSTLSSVSEAYSAVKQKLMFPLSFKRSQPEAHGFHVVRPNTDGTVAPSATILSTLRADQGNADVLLPR